MKIRKAESKDFEKILMLNKKLFEFEKQFSDAYNLEWTCSERGRKYFEERLKHAMAECWVAEDDNRVVGYLVSFINTYSYRSTNPICEIENMFIEQDFRRKGVGRALIEELKITLKSRGVKKIRVESVFKNEGAVYFYKAMGFEDFNLILEIGL